jgi:hypothetical protein
VDVRQQAKDGQEMGETYEVYKEVTQEEKEVTLDSD